MLRCGFNLLRLSQPNAAACLFGTACCSLIINSKVNGKPPRSFANMTNLRHMVSLMTNSSGLQLLVG